VYLSVLLSSERSDEISASPVFIDRLGKHAFLLRDAESAHKFGHDESAHKFAPC